MTETPEEKKERKRAYRREYHAKNRERLNALARARHHANKEERNAKRRIWWEQNRERSQARHRAWYEKNRERVLERSREQSRQYRFKQHGLTEADFIAMSSAQGDVCAICASECDVQNRLSIDHDHQTGKVRGLLCHRCNVGIGYFRDSTVFLIEAAKYLVERMTAE